MSVRKVFMTLIVVSLSFLAAGCLQAQVASSGPAAVPAPPVSAEPGEGEIDGGLPAYIKEETPEQRRERLGTPEDPGLNPDPDKAFVRFGRQYRIRKYDRRFARYLPNKPNVVRPVGMVNFEFEIYQQNENWVWVWIEDLEQAEPAAVEQPARPAKQALTPEGVKYLEMIREEFTPLDPPASPVRIRFEEASDGLPPNGSWRNGGAVADMNGDGFADLILPPQRAGNGVPNIFLGDGKGNWKHWKIDWPTRINYGAVVAADFNKDKKMDLAFAIHLAGVAIFHGDGKGGFKEVFYDRAFPSRRLITSDIDNDGAMDIVAISEGPTGRSGDPKAREYTALRGYLNREKGRKFEGFNIAHKNDNMSGDWLAAGRFNSDRYPDFVASTIYLDGTSTVQMSQGKPKEYDFFWDGVGKVIPFRSYYYAATTGRFSQKDRDDAVVTSFRVWPNSARGQVETPPLQQVVSIDRLQFSADGKAGERIPIMRWPAGRAVPGMASGDLDGDGKQDVIFTRHDPREAVLLLGDGKGGFARAQFEGLPLRPQANYDILLADVNGDSRPDVIMMYESQSATSLSARDGSVHVFLNRGVVKE